MSVTGQDLKAPVRPEERGPKGAPTQPAQQVSVASPAGGAAGPFYPWVDVLRGLSWPLAVIAHSGAPGRGHLGRVGAGIFFAISGWLITGIILEVGPDTGLFAEFC
jgi:peptidoglycan/LPS O-acetylase OafA/YrhL